MMKALLEMDPRMVDAVLALDPDAIRTDFCFDCQSPLIFAAGLQPAKVTMPDVLDLLINAGADVNACDANGCTALAALCKGLALRKDLAAPAICGPSRSFSSGSEFQLVFATWLDRLPAPASKNQDLRTVLKAATKLLSAGANPNLQDARGQTAIGLAKLAEQKILEQFLRNYQGTQALVVLNRAAQTAVGNSSPIGRLSDGLVRMICSHLVDEEVERRVYAAFQINIFRHSCAPEWESSPKPVAEQ